MVCFCSARLEGLLASLAAVAPTAGLVPPLRADLLAAAGGPPQALAAASALGSAEARLVANLSAMASLSQALQAGIGFGLDVALSPPRVAATRAVLAGAIESFNTNAGPLDAFQARLSALLADLSGLARLAGVVMGARTVLGIDLRVGGAVAALEARLGATASVSAPEAPALAVSARQALLLSLGVAADMSGGPGMAIVEVQARLLGALMAALPPVVAGVTSLGALASLMAMLEAIELGLGVDLRAAGAALELAAVLRQLPLSALAALCAPAPAPLSVDAALAPVIDAARDFGAVARLDLAAAGPLALLLRVMARADLGVRFAGCGAVCPLGRVS